MDTQAANSITASPVTASSNSVFDVPVHDVSSALNRLLGQKISVAGKAKTVEEVLSGARLGVASGLFRALRLKHPPTAKHCLRVALGCSTFAHHLHLDQRTRDQLEIAALLHDVGKIGIPEHVLHKPSRLQPDEVELMGRHRAYAMHILEAFCEDPQILSILRYSTAWFDGTQPRDCTIAGDELPLGARILAIVNAFDSMTTDKVYRRALPQERAIAELYESASTQFDPQLVAEFAKLHSNDASTLQTDVIRRWVELATDDGDFWTFDAPLIDKGNDGQAMFQTRLLESLKSGVVFVNLSGHVMVWNRAAEELTGLSKESVQHREWHPQIIDLRDSEGNAIKPKSCPLLECLRSLSESTQRMTITNRGSTSHTFVDVQVMPVQGPNGACHGAILTLHDVSSETTLEARVQTLHTRATRDGLTGVGNRAEFDRRLEEMVGTSMETGESLALIICDIDRFKSINDTYGHQAGDAALIEFASLVVQNSRGDDIVARYGGEEFVVLCPGCTNELATKKAEEMRRALAGTNQAALNNTRMTASFGVTELQQGDTPETILKRADRALYQAKDTGRNRVVQLGGGMGENEDSDSTKKKTSWFSWGREQVPDEMLSKRLRSNVPLNVVTEKVRGFIADNDAEVTAAHNNSVSLCFDDRHLPTQRRNSDRPITLIMEVELQDDQEVGSGTLILVKITAQRGRDRRLEEAAERADRLFLSIKSYLIAEEV